MKQLLIVFLPAFFWASSDVLSKFSAEKISPILGSVVLAFSMMVTLVSLSFFLLPAPASELIKTPARSIWLALSSGVLNGLGFFFFFRFLKLNGSFTQGLPLVFVFTMVTATLYGIFILGDPLNIRIVLGIILALVSVYLLS